MEKHTSDNETSRDPSPQPRFLERERERSRKDSGREAKERERTITGAPNVLQLPSEVERCPVSDLSPVYTKGIQPELDRLTASFSLLMHSYYKAHWFSQGPQHRDLHEFFEEGYKECAKSMDLLAERMTLLGIVPTASPTMQSSLSVVVSEAEGIFPMRDVIQKLISSENRISSQLRALVAVTIESRDYSTEMLLKEELMKLEHRVHELDHYLAPGGL